MVNKQSSVGIYSDDLAQWNRWLDGKNMSSAEFIREMIAMVKRKKQADFYLSLSMPSEYRKALQGVKIRKNYKK